MDVQFYQHPFDEPSGVRVNQCVALAEGHWFEVPCTPISSWRLRKPYFGPKTGLLPVAEPIARELRRAVNDPRCL